MENNNGSVEVMANPTEPGSGVRNKLPGGMMTARNKKDGVDTSCMPQDQFFFLKYI